MKRDYYDILGISKSADASAIKKAYRKLAKKYHPDSNEGNAAAAEKFKEINEAYDILSDEEKRKLYDQFGHAAFEDGAAGYQNGPSREYHFEGNGDMDDILNHIFGNAGGFGSGCFRSGSFGSGGFRSGGFGSGGFGSGGFGSGSFGSGGFDGRDPGGHSFDLHAELEISLQEAAFGCKKTVHLRDDHGTVQSLEVRIPAGIASGKTIRLRGKGMQNSRSGRTGDLLLTVTVRDHPGFRREGDDLYTTITIPFTTAILGGQVPVSTIDGTVLCQIREGTQSGSKIRLKGKGIVNMANPAVRGDQYVTVEVQIPVNLSPEARQKLREFEAACRKTHVA